MGALMTPMTGTPLRRKAMETQNIGNKWVKFTVPGVGQRLPERRVEGKEGPSRGSILGGISLVAGW